jgi:hypothetical protein
VVTFKKIDMPQRVLALSEIGAVGDNDAFDDPDFGSRPFRDVACEFDRSLGVNE